MSKHKKDEDVDVVNCPHCGGAVVILELNCKIFRHGTFIKDGKQINPHEIKELCDIYVKENLIYGCGKPFKVTKEGKEYKAEICDYI